MPFTACGEVVAERGAPRRTAARGLNGGGGCRAREPGLSREGGAAPARPGPAWPAGGLGELAGLGCRGGLGGVAAPRPLPSAGSTPPPAGGVWGRLVWGGGLGASAAPRCSPLLLGASAGGVWGLLPAGVVPRPLGASGLVWGLGASGAPAAPLLGSGGVCSPPCLLLPARAAGGAHQTRRAHWCARAPRPLGARHHHPTPAALPRLGVSENTNAPIVWGRLVRGGCPVWCHNRGGMVPHPPPAGGRIKRP